MPAAFSTPDDVRQFPLQNSTSTMVIPLLDRGWFRIVGAIQNGLRAGRANSHWKLRENRYGSRSKAHQIWQRIADGLAIASPSLQPNARANSGMLDGGAMARKRPNGCGFVFTIRRSNSGRSLDAQICANARKKRWSAVKPPMSAGFFPFSAF